MLTDLDILFDANPAQAKGIAAIYQTLLGGVPSIGGFTFLISENNATNFGAGSGAEFNFENVFINITNALVQGNADASTAFASLASGANLVEIVTSLYQAIIPPAYQTSIGLSFLTRPEGLAFYEQVATERGIASANGPAIIAMASLLKVAVDEDIGVGDAANDLIDAVKIGSAVLPDSSTTVTPIEIADGTGFDNDDVTTGSVITLKSAVENIKGSDSNDIFVGNNTTLSTDTLDGMGGADILRVTDPVGANFAPTLTAIERIEINSDHTSVTNFNLASAAGVTTLAVIGSTGNLTVTDAKTVHNLEITNTTGDASVALNYAAATVAGEADSQKIALNSATLGGGLAIDNVEMFDITITGTNIIETIIGSKAITVNGVGNLTASVFATAGISAYDASAASGTQRITFKSVSDVVVKGSSASDAFDFGANFTSADIVHGGDGTDLVALDGGNFSNSTNDTLKGLNALTSIELIGFTKSGVTIDRSTFTNSAVVAIGFSTDTGIDSVFNTDSVTTYAFAASNAGDAFFVMRAGSQVLNLELSGSSTRDADVGNLSTGKASTVNIASLGSFSVGASESSTNNIGNVTNATNATFNLVGASATLIKSFSNAVTVNASALTGKFAVATSDANDRIIGGSGENDIEAFNGVDEINLSASTGARDFVSLYGILSANNRDIITGFETGADRDIVLFSHQDTSATTASGSAVKFQQITAGDSGGFTFQTATNDVLVLNFNIDGSSLGDGSAQSLDGTALLAEIGAMGVSDPGGQGLYFGLPGRQQLYLSCGRRWRHSNHRRRNIFGRHISWHRHMGYFQYSTRLRHSHNGNVLA